MKIILYVIFAVVLISGGYVLNVYYKSATQKVSEENIAPVKKDEKLNDIKLTQTNESVWTNNVVQNNNVSYQYPSNVATISLDVKRENEMRTDYAKVLIKNLDDYKFFCLNEILRQRNINFSYYRDNKSLNVVVFLPNVDIRDKVLQDFKYYHIDYELAFKK